MSDDEIPTPEQEPGLRPAIAALRDAHEQWHETFEVYHHPSKFIRSVESLIQTLRNITFRLQSQKSSLPNFDTWYPECQDYMRQDAKMSWLNEERVEITKRAGLRAASFIQIRTIASYLENPVEVFSVPIDTDTSDVLRRALGSLPSPVKANAYIIIGRRWASPVLKSSELLSALAHCWFILDAIIVFAFNHIRNSEFNETFADFSLSMDRPSCLQEDPTLYPQIFQADTGEEVSIEGMPAKIDHTVAAQASARYNFPATDLATDPVDLAHDLHDIARTIFKKDGFHYPFLHLRGPDGEWEVHTFMPDSKRDKYLYFHMQSMRVDATGIDALIHTTEVWTASLNSISQMGVYPDLSTAPDRGEDLITFVDTADGRSQVISSEIVHFLERPYLKPHRTIEIQPENYQPGFQSPIRRIWGFEN